MKLPENALHLFKNGFNCSQAVFTSYAVTKGIDRETALKISRGFGAGMGRMQETCGAVTGAYMAIGLSFENPAIDEKQIREETYNLITEFQRRFSKIYNTTICLKILEGCNLSTEDGQIHFKENNLLEETCYGCVRNSAEILETLIS